MYIGIGPERGNIISEEDAFVYACKWLFSEPLEERITAMQIFRESDNFLEAEIRITEWYYSGNWIRQDTTEVEDAIAYRRINNLEQIFWIRYSDGAIGCSSRYREAVVMAEEYIKNTELTYLIY